MKVGKPQSKRVPVRLRHKIQKASSAKQRKQRKEAKKNPQWRSRLKKDPGIPNLFPYKAKVLAEIEEGKRKKEEEAQRRREVAKAQRQGTIGKGSSLPAVTEHAEVEDDELLDDDSILDEDEEMDEGDSNPMAALLASARARARNYDDIEVGDGDEADEEDAWGGIERDDSNTATMEPNRKALPKMALADPIKAVSALLARMEKTTDGIQRLIEHYQIPPLATAGSDLTSRFLVEVARKRGRLGRGGVPNLRSAGLTVLSDLNEERLILPALDPPTNTNTSARGKGEVRIVSQKAEPFRIEGIWGDDVAANDGPLEKTRIIGSQ